MNVLEVIQRITKSIGMAVPSQVFASDSRDAIELGSLANQTAERISNEYNWQRLRRLHTITGDGSSQSFVMPYDFAKFPEGTTLRDSRGALEMVKDPDEWLDRQLRGYVCAYSQWTMVGDRIEILPILADGHVVKFWYQSDRIVRSNGTAANSSFPYTLPFELADSDEYGYARSEFSTDDDFFQLSWRLLELGMIWQWRANKGLPYAEDMRNYTIMLSQLVGADGGRRDVKMGQRRSDYRSGRLAMTYVATAPASSDGGHNVLVDDT